MTALPTVKIVAAGARGWRIINESAFDPKVHKLFDAPPAPEVEVEAEPKGKRKAHR